MKEQDKKRINDIRDICGGIEYIEQEQVPRMISALEGYLNGNSECSLGTILDSIIPHYYPSICIQDFESGEWKIIEDAIIDLARLVIKDYKRKKQELEEQLL